MNTSPLADRSTTCAAPWRSCRLVAAALASALLVSCSASVSAPTSASPAPAQPSAVPAVAASRPATAAATTAAPTVAATSPPAPTTTPAVAAPSPTADTGAATAATAVATASAAAPQTVPVSQAPPSTQALASAQPLDGMAIANVVTKDRPGVVQITSEQESLQNLRSVIVPSGVGTGMLLDQQGNILTNNHVIAGAQKLEVLFTDGRSVPATVVGADPRTDLAVIKVNATNLTPLELGDSSSLAVGQWVVAIGNALALQGGPTVTKGVISALGRVVQEPSSQTGAQAQGAAASAAGPYLFDLVQTSAPINPGNSGGPLIDLNGRVIGVNTLVAGQAEPGVQASGIGFAIAINTARRIAQELISTGRVAHAYMGISSQQSSPALATRLGLPTDPGVIVADVTQGSPAAQAGLQRGDLITAVDGQPLTTESSLPKLLNTKRPGDVVTLTVLRAGGVRQVIKLTLGTFPTG